MIYAAFFGGRWRRLVDGANGLFDGRRPVGFTGRRRRFCSPCCFSGAPLWRLHYSRKRRTSWIPPLYSMAYMLLAAEKLQGSAVLRHLEAGAGKTLRLERRNDRGCGASDNCRHSVGGHCLALSRFLFGGIVRNPAEASLVLTDRFFGLLFLKTNSGCFPGRFICCAGRAASSTAETSPISITDILLGRMRHVVYRFDLATRMRSTPSRIESR